MNKYFINLTNGIEYLKDHSNLDYSFIRIQSTHCEQKLWNRVIEELDYNFLMSLALGYNCIVIDYGSRTKSKSGSRAQWQGIAFIKYILYKRWFKKDVDIYLGPLKLSDHFSEVYKTKITKANKKKLDYFKKFLFTDELKIECMGGFTDKDGKNDFYKEVLKERTYNDRVCDIS